MSNNKKAIVVGSGIAGIASAIRLAVAGYSVVILEKNTYPGGKLTEIKLGDYRFDAGPSLFTMPQFVEELYDLAGKKTSDYFTYTKSKTACHYFFEDGTFIPFLADKEELAQTVGEVLQIDEKPIRDYFNHSEYIYKKTHKSFLEQSLHKFENYFTKEVLETFAVFPILGLFSTLHEQNMKKLNHPKLVQIFDRYATYNGSNPFQAPGILQVIPHLEHGFGTFFPNRGMHDIPQGLLRLAKDIGIDIKLEHPVDEIVVENGNLKGVKSKGRLLAADLVFCNSDIRPAYQYLLPSENIPKRVLKQEPSSSAMIFYWGIKQKFEKLDLHNIFFAENYKKEFDAIFLNKTVDDDPTVYIHVSSKMKGDDAPQNGENWFVMVNVPSNCGQNWEKLRIQIRENVLKKLSRMLGIEIESLIEEEDYLDPIRIEKRTSSYAGALYGASSNDKMAAFFRHPNFSKIKGLHFIGGSVHPGGGIPLCLLSAKIAVSTIKK